VNDSLEHRYKRFRENVPVRTETLDGVRWRWFEQGHGARAVVILPGAVGGADLFFLLSEILSPHVRVLGIDLPYVEDADALMTQLAALLRGRGLLPGGLLGARGLPTRSALGDARTEQVAADDLHGHDHEQPQYGQETQPHDREGQL